MNTSISSMKLENSGKIYNKIDSISVFGIKESF